MQYKNTKICIVMETPTFENLPNAVFQLFNKLENIERLLSERNPKTQPEPDRWFDLSELCAYLSDKPAKPTVYGWVGSSLIPVHKTAKKLRFLKSEIDLWQLSGRKKTLQETAKEADQYLSKRKGRS